ncbi:hypothetical protein E8E13_007194 [Curvularia kusanoi]|uniref:Uncharacterized protein n=1 Tax=Curvularia kusanoi TaxID=90978 RepID=A0A9P4TCU5_CURKU|nr:hypothetical protein E8E13_007194 [Curvularia kusanoi]
MSDHSDTSLLLDGAHSFPSTPPPPQVTRFLSPPMEDKTVKTDVDAPQDLQQTPKSGHKRVNSDDTERPTSVQRDRDDLGQIPDAGAETSDSDDEHADPALQIEDYNWQELHERYHNIINTCNAEEKELMEEWANLMEYFRIWANSGHVHETDRTFRRLQTRTVYVQHEEEDLENKRNHYISVVKAFESALNLLKQNPMFRG